MFTVLEINNKHESALRVDLEPYAHSYLIEPNETIEVVCQEPGTKASLNFGVTPQGQPYLAVWPNGPELFLYKDNKNIFNF